MRGDVAGLLGVAGIALLDRDGEQQPRVADLVRPGRGDAGTPAFSMFSRSSAERTMAR